MDIHKNKYKYELVGVRELSSSPDHITIEYVYSFYFISNPDIKYEISFNISDFPEFILNDPESLFISTSENLVRILNNLLFHKLKIKSH